MGAKLLRAERLLRRRSLGRCGSSHASSAASGLTPCSMSIPMSVNADFSRESEVLFFVNRTTMRSIARAPHYRCAGVCCVDVWACGSSPVSSVASGLTPCSLSSPMSIDAGCRGSRARGTALLLFTWGTPGLHKGTWSPIYWSVCGADDRVSPFTWGIIPVS